MSTDHKIRHKEKSKSRNIRKKGPVASVKKTEVKKISEKYLTEELQVENSLKLRNANKTNGDDYAKQKQNEIDFFCDPFSAVRLDKPEKLPIEESNDENRERENENEEEISAKSEAHSARSNESPNTHLASTYIGQEYETVVEKFELERVLYDEIELLFNPRADNDLKIINDEERGNRSEIDEGLFVPQEPKARSNHNKLLLINRLNESGGTELINCTGNLKNSRKIFDDEVYRLVCDKKFTPIYVPPIPMTFECVNKIIHEKKFLKIFLSELAFDQHNLFTAEHQVAKVVEKLFTEYERRKKSDIVGTLRNKLSNLREVKKQHFPISIEEDVKNPRSLKNEEISLNNQIKKVRQKLHVEDKYDHMVVKSLLENWKKLKGIRSQQGFSFTHVALKIQKAEVFLAAKQVEWQQQYDAELNEMVTEEFEEYYLTKKSYKEFIRKVNDPVAINDDHEIVKKPKKPDIDTIVTKLNEIYDEIPSNEPNLNIILKTNPESSTETSSKPKDKLKKIGRYSYRVELEVDGEIVGSTKHCKLDENFNILIQSAFILKLTKQIPEIVKLLVS